MAWWDHHQGVPEFSGEKWTNVQRDDRTHELNTAHAERWGLNHVEGLELPGLSREPGKVHNGGTSGYQALNLALHFGADPILLLGYDYSDGGHWFGRHPEPLANTSFLANAEAFRAAAADLRELGRRVVNCTPGSKIDAFERGDIRHEL